MHVCLFDIDGTLLSSGGAGKEAMYRAIRSEFQVPQVQDGVPFAGRTDRAIVRDLFALHAIEDSPSNFRRFVAAYLGHLPASLTERQGKVLPGVAQLLEQLGARDDVVVGLLTGNIRDGARTKLGHFGLFHHFAFGGFGDHHLDRNDVAREALAEVRKHFSGPLRLEQIWVIGDTPLDIRCARAIGARVLAVATGLHSGDDLAGERPDILLANLLDASLLLARIAGAITT
jgi:phosphoglycolate phosphatase-like HAD superfamily hydrolase